MGENSSTETAHVIPWKIQQRDPALAIDLRESIRCSAHANHTLMRARLRSWCALASFGLSKIGRN